MLNTEDTHIRSIAPYSLFLYVHAILERDENTIISFSSVQTLSIWSIAISLHSGLDFYYFS